MITAPLYSSRWETYGLHHSNLACYQCAAKTFLVPEHFWCGGTCTERDRAHLSFHLSRKFLKKGCSVAIPVTLSMPVGCIYTCVLMIADHIGAWPLAQLPFTPMRSLALKHLSAIKLKR